MSEFDWAQLGFAGVAILAMARVIYVQWNRNNQIQDARLQDAKDHAHEIRTIAESSTEAIRDINTKLDGINDT